MDDGVLWKNTLQSISENGLISNWVWNMFSIIPAFFMSRLTVWHSVNIIFSLCHIQSTGLSDFSCCKCPLPTLKLEVQADTWLWRKNKVTRDVFERGSDSFGMFCRNEICPYSRFLDVVGNSEAGLKSRWQGTAKVVTKTFPRKGISEILNLQIIAHFLRVPKVLLLL